MGKSRRTKRRSSPLAETDVSPEHFRWAVSVVSARISFAVGHDVILSRDLLFFFVFFLLDVL